MAENSGTWCISASNHNKLTEEDQLFVLLPKIKGYLITFLSIANETQYKDKP